jgi:hypothetical protein
MLRWRKTLPNSSSSISRFSFWLVPACRSFSTWLLSRPRWKKATDSAASAAALVICSAHRTMSEPPQSNSPPPPGTRCAAPAVTLKALEIGAGGRRAHPLHDPVARFDTLKGHEPVKAARLSNAFRVAQSWYGVGSEGARPRPSAAFSNAFSVKKPQAAAVGPSHQRTSYLTTKIHDSSATSGSRQVQARFDVNVLLLNPTAKVVMKFVLV